MKIVFFDGYCVLCNGIVDWLIKIDKNKILKFASLQGESAKRLLNSKSGLVDANTVIYLRDNKQFDRSAAIIMLLSDMGMMWKVVFVFLIIPKFFRDFFYKIIAHSRYQLFGKRNTCRLPTKDEQERILP